MTGPSASTWLTRDLPVLRAIAEHFDQDPDDILDNHFEVSGLEDDDVYRAIRALGSRYLDIDVRHSFGGGRAWYSINGITEDARRTVGLWPSGESVDALVSALQQAADNAEDPEEQSKLRKIAGQVLQVPRDIMVDVVGAVISKSITG